MRKTMKKEEYTTILTLLVVGFFNSAKMGTNWT